MKLDQAEKATILGVLSAVFEIPLDDQNKTFIVDIATKFSELMTFEDNAAILETFSDILGNVGTKSLADQPYDIMQLIYSTKMTMMFTGFLYGYLYRMSEARKTSLLEM